MRSHQRDAYSLDGQTSGESRYLGSVTYVAINSSGQIWASGRAKEGDRD